MFGYLSLEVICSSKLTVFLELRPRKTVRFSEQIMSAVKYPNKFSCQMEATVYIFSLQMETIVYIIWCDFRFSFIYFPFSSMSLSFHVSLINVNSLFFTQSPCEYSPCRNGAPCLPLYRSNSYYCMLRPTGKIEQGRMYFELHI